MTLCDYMGIRSIKHYKLDNRINKWDFSLSYGHEGKKVYLCVLTLKIQMETL